MGKAVIFSAPSGGGKTTIVQHLLGQNLDLAFSISACTRNPRPNEINGKDYYFLSSEEFQGKIQEEAFVEWEELYGGNYYGTLKSEVQRVWNEGKHVIFDVDVKGGISLKNHFGDQALSIFVRPPSIEELKRRLVGRGTESDEDVAKRLERATMELSKENDFDYVLINDQLEVACSEAVEVVSGYLNR